MKINVLIFTFLCFNISLFSQEFIYGGNIGNWVHDFAIDMDKTSDGSLIMTVDNQARYWTGGQYASDTFFGLHKIDKAGRLVWNFDFFRQKNGFEEYSISQTTLDENDNIYALIYTYQKDNPDTINGIVVYPGLNVAKIDPQGKPLWFRKIGTTDNNGSSILYKNGHLYVVSLYEGNITLGNKNLSSNNYYQCFMWMNMQGSDYLISKFDSNGNFINAISTGEDYPDIAIDATIDDNENIYFTGVSDYFAGCINAYSHITKVDKDLNIVWKKTISMQYNYDGLFYPTNIYLAKNQKLYVWGNFYQKDANIFNLNITCDCSSSGGYFGSCLLEINSTEGEYLRKMQLNNCSVNSNYGGSEDIRKHFTNGYMDELDGNLMVHTAFTGTLLIGDTTINSTYYTDFYNYNLQNLLLLSVSFNDLTPKHIATFTGDAKSYNFPGKIIADNNHNLYVSGTFSDNPLYVANSPIINNSGNNNYDVFYCKLLFNSQTSKINEIYQNKLEPEVYPNPCSTSLKYRNAEGIDKVRIIDLNGKIITEQEVTEENINVKSLNPGTYLIQLFDGDKMISKKIIIKK